MQLHGFSLGLWGLMESLLLDFAWDAEQVMLMQFRTSSLKDSFAFKVNACIMN